MDWKAFMYEKMAGDLKVRYDAVRKYDKTHMAAPHASPVSLFGSPYGTGAEDDFLMADEVIFMDYPNTPSTISPATGGHGILWLRRISLTAPIRKMVAIM